ncbi:MAG TPA: hypothetical protein VFP32_00170 [Candidatus Saccharimonadales bacterium]|nr:hypothetical protein [Candidatus Saccharimonadales bacterium]
MARPLKVIIIIEKGREQKIKNKKKHSVQQHEEKAARQGMRD